MWQPSVVFLDDVPNVKCEIPVFDCQKSHNSHDVRIGSFIFSACESVKFIQITILILDILQCGVPEIAKLVYNFNN